MKEFKQLIGHEPKMFLVQNQQIYDHAVLPVVTDQLSVTLRLKLFEHSPGWTTIFHKGTEDLVRTPGLWATPAGNLHVRFSGNSNNNDGINKIAYALSLNKWYHISYTLSDSEKKLLLYIDGKLSGSYSFQQKVTFNNGPLYLGRTFIHGGFNGEISNFRYFNWSLSAEEVNEDFDKVDGLFQKNKKWSEDKNKNDKQLFDKLKEQHPEVLWIGCSDSRVPPELITQSGFGELFVHRNIANQFNPNDANCMSVLQYAVNHLKVSHIVICGHTGCGGAKNCFEPGLEPDLEKWLEGIRELETINPEFSHNNPNFGTPEVQDKLVKANVVKQVEKISKNYFVKSAKQTIQIHGFVFDLKNGLLLKVI